MQDSTYSSLYNNESECSSMRTGREIKQKIRKLILRKKNLNDNSKEITEISENYPDLLQLNLSYNNLTILPQNINILKNLISIDLRKNAFKDINKIINNLSKFQYLTDLKIDFSNSSQVQTLLNKIPNLLYINGKSTEEYITAVDVNKEYVDEISIEKKLPEFNDLFVMFQNNYQNENQEELAKDLYDKFQNLINEEANKINNNNTSSNLPNYILANNIIKSELNLILFFINSFFNNCEYLTMENAKKDISQKINDILILLFKTLANIIEELNDKIESINKLKNKKIELLLEYLNDPNINIINNLNLGNNNIKDDNINSKINNVQEEYEKLRNKYNEDKELYNLKIEKLQKENKQMTDLLIKKGLELSSSTNVNNINNNSILSTNSLKKSGTEINKNEVGPDPTLLGLTGAKILSKKQMHDFMNEIYESKIEYDKICNENHLKRESMEHYMYKFLNNKYGLKNLVIEWSSSIITGIKMYSSSDSDINLFGKILKNKIEEGQRLVVNKLKSTIKELYDTYIKNKNKLIMNKNKNKINDKEIEKILSSFSEDILLNEDEWKNIIKSIYNEDEYKIITKYILNKISDKNDIQKKNYINNLMSKKKSEVTRDDLELASKIKFAMKISYKEFENILIGYQITYREKYLSNLHKLFIRYDEDSLGVLNENGFKKLLNSVGFIQKEGIQFMKKLLNKIDPHSYNNITFSDIVNLFSEEILTDEDGLTMNILDKLGLEDPSNLNLE
jgi:hypothetical protein